MRWQMPIAITSLGRTSGKSAREVGRSTLAPACFARYAHHLRGIFAACASIAEWFLPNEYPKA
jgi:hypothetical protein